MIYGSIVCEVTVAENYNFFTEVPCEYEKDTIAYAVEHFFTRCRRFRRECTYQSWQHRIAKGKAKRPEKFTYLIPAILMELPGGWVRLAGKIDVTGVRIHKVELLKEHPYLARGGSDEGRQRGEKNGKHYI